jgi:hypothetical protein
VVAQDAITKSLSLACFLILLCDSLVLQYVTLFPDNVSNMIGFGSHAYHEKFAISWWNDGYGLGSTMLNGLGSAMLNGFGGIIILGWRRSA